MCVHHTSLEIPLNCELGPLIEIICAGALGYTDHPGAVVETYSSA
jgi:hypothetical protein